MRAKTLHGEVRITGIINDEEFAAEGEAEGSPETGEYSVRLAYERVPTGWHPLMYTDVKVSLLFLREEKGGQNFLTLAGGSYRSAGSIDLGEGNLLRNNTDIRMIGNDTFRAVYVMHGTAHTGELTGMDYFEETMLPFGDGKVAALALARWSRREGDPVEAIFSTRYMFDSGRQLEHPQFRRVEAQPSFTDMVFESRYQAYVAELPRDVEAQGRYIGHLIS